MLRLLKLCVPTIMVATLLAGCGSSSGHSATSTNSSTRPSSTTSSSTTSVGTTCHTAALTVSLGSPSGAAGTTYYDLVFKNDAASSCTLSGYPGVSFLDSSGAQIGVPVPRSTSAHSTVSLAPGASAYAALGVTDPSIPPCTAATAAQIRVFPPNQTDPALLPAPATLQVCVTKLPPGSIGPVADHANG